MYVVGVRQRSKKDKLKWIDKLVNYLIYFMVFVMGLRMGSNKDIVDSLGSIGIQSVICTIIVISGSMLGVTLMRKVIGMDRRACKIGSEEAEKYAADEMAETDLSGIRSTAVIAAFVAAGMVLGFIIIYKKFDLGDEFMEKSTPYLNVCLIMLIGSVGLSMGLSGNVFRSLKTAGIGILLFPIGAVLGSLVGGIVFSFISPVGVREAIAISMGFGWYTYAPNIIAQAGYPVASAISFMHNVLREITGIIGIPFFAYKIGYVEAAAIPGVASMDICLPIVERATREDVVIYSFTIGLLMCLSTPIVVPLVIGA